VLALPAGGVAIYEENLNLKQYRDDVVFYPVPFDKITAAICPEAKLRKLVKNMVYVGVVAQLLAIDLGVVEKRPAQAVCQEAEGLRAELRRGEGGLRLRGGEVHQAGPVLHRADEQTAGKIIIDGNAAAAWARCLRA
jgi:2-oxoglutarate ferredoxin oxidoreductase subunit alpha